MVIKFQSHTFRLNGECYNKCCQLCANVAFARGLINERVNCSDDKLFLNSSVARLCWLLEKYQHYSLCDVTGSMVILTCYGYRLIVTVTFNIILIMIHTCHGTNYNLIIR